MKTGLITSDTYKNHDTGPGHPEQIARVSVIEDNFKKLKNFFNEHVIRFTRAIGIESVNTKQGYAWFNLYNKNALGYTLVYGLLKGDSDIAKSKILVMIFVESWVVGPLRFAFVSTCSNLAPNLNPNLSVRSYFVTRYAA